MYPSVLITGASGFIGSHLVRHQLSLGRQVRALDVYQPKTQPGSGAAVEWMVGDIADPVLQEEVAQGVDLVFHLASAHLAVNVPEETYWRVNVHCLRGFLERCHRAGVKRFVHVSSVGVYGNIENPPANEDSPCRPDLLYERTKYEGELQVRKYFAETGFPVVVVRPAWVYGPGCPRTEKLFRTIKKNRFFFVGGGRALRHCIYITDMLEAFELCAQHPKAPGKVFVFGDHAAVTVRELVRQMAVVAGAKPPRLSIPVGAFKPACVLVERAFTFFRKEPPFSERSLKFFTNNTSFDIGRARRELGFNPRIMLQDGLRLTYQTVNAKSSSAV